jgi:hypothetical protein
MRRLTSRIDCASQGGHLCCARLASRRSLGRQIPVTNSPIPVARPGSRWHPPNLIMPSDTGTLFNTHSCRVRRRHERLPSSGCIESDPAVTFRLTPGDHLAGSLPIQSYHSSSTGRERHMSGLEYRGQLSVRRRA